MATQIKYPHMSYIIQGCNECTSLLPRVMWSTHFVIKMSTSPWRPNHCYATQTPSLKLHLQPYQRDSLPSIPIVVYTY